MKCRKCKSEKLEVRIETFKDGSEHNRLMCTDCGVFQKFLNSTDAKNFRMMVGDSVEDVTLAEINFKLDLILDHLGIVEK